MFHTSPSFHVKLALWITLSSLCLCGENAWRSLRFNLSFAFSPFRHCNCSGASLPASRRACITPAARPTLLAMQMAQKLSFRRQSPAFPPAASAAVLWHKNRATMTSKCSSSLSMDFDSPLHSQQGVGIVGALYPAGVSAVVSGAGVSSGALKGVSVTHSGPAGSPPTSSRP